MAGERYRVSLADKESGAWWWGFGDLEKDFKALKFRQLMDGSGGYEGDGDEQKGVLGETPEQLKMVMEGEGPEFEIL